MVVIVSSTSVPQVLFGVETGIAGACLSPGPSQLASSLVRGVFVFSKGIEGNKEGHPASSLTSA